MTSPRDQSHEPAWQAFLTRQCARTPIEGTVASIVPFGAFIELGEGVHGLLHRSEWTAEPSVGSSPARTPTRYAAHLFQRMCGVRSGCAGGGLRA